MSDYPRSLIAFQRRFGDEAACADFLCALRWPDGFACPACGHDRAWQLRTKPWTYECRGCRRQTSVKAGTLLHASKLPLSVWFWAAYLMATHSNGISALQLQKQLALGSYKTAWLLCTKLRAAMVDPERNPLAGLVEIDETSIHHRPGGKAPSGSYGRNAQGKLLIVGAIEIKDNGPGHLRLAPIADYSSNSLHSFIAANIAPQSTAKAGPPIPAPRTSNTSRTSSPANPPMKSCPGSTGFSQTSKPGRSASTTACGQSTCNPTSTSSSSASTAAEAAMPASDPCSEPASGPNPSPTKC